MLNYMLLRIVVNGHRGMLHPSPYGDAVYVNATVEINVFNYNVAVRSVNGV